MTLSVHDLSSTDTDIFRFRAGEKDLQRLGSFERILQREMHSAERSGPDAAEVDDEKLLEVCHEMESLFIGQMLKTMRNTIMETDFFGKSLVKDIFNDMLYDEYAKKMAATDKFGLALKMYAQIRATA
jgi:flagellar protein FlgJ